MSLQSCQNHMEVPSFHALGLSWETLAYHPPKNPYITWCSSQLLVSLKLRPHFLQVFFDMEPDFGLSWVKVGSTTPWTASLSKKSHEKKFGEPNSQSSTEATFSPCVTKSCMEMPDVSRLFMGRKSSCVSESLLALVEKLGPEELLVGRKFLCVSESAPILVEYWIPCRKTTASDAAVSLSEWVDLMMLLKTVLENNLAILVETNTLKFRPCTQYWGELKYISKLSLVNGIPFARRD